MDLIVLGNSKNGIASVPLSVAGAQLTWPTELPRHMAAFGTLGLELGCAATAQPGLWQPVGSPSCQL